MSLYIKKNKTAGLSRSFYSFAMTCLLIITISPASFAHKNAKYQSTLAKRIKFYPLYFNTLQLTPEQRSKFEYITEKYNIEYQNNLKYENALKELSKQEEKEIKQILDKRQKSQFKIIKHLEKQDIKRAFKEKDYYKSNPRMSVFGNLQKK